jgi:hypothetical protein
MALTPFFATLFDMDFDATLFDDAEPWLVRERQLVRRTAF